MDTATSDIRAVEFTPSSDGDIEPVSATGSSEPARVLPELLDQIPEGEEIGTVTGDGACDTRRCHRFGAYAAPSGATVPYAHHPTSGNRVRGFLRTDGSQPLTPDPQERPTLE